MDAALKKKVRTEMELFSPWIYVYTYTGLCTHTYTHIGLYVFIYRIYISKIEDKKK